MTESKNCLECFPALLHPTTPEEIKAAFDLASPTDVHAWIQARFPSTVTSRRQSAYAEYKATIKRATNQPETT